MNAQNRKLKVLLASSASTVLPSMQFILKKTFRHDVITASEPEEVIRQVMDHQQDNPIDVVITGTFKHSETDYRTIVEQVKQIDPHIHCALYTGDNYINELPPSSGTRLDGCFLKKNGPHADLKPLFDRLTGIA